MPEAHTFSLFAFTINKARPLQSTASFCSKTTLFYSTMMSATSAKSSANPTLHLYSKHATDWSATSVYWSAASKSSISEDDSANVELSDLPSRPPVSIHEVAANTGPKVQQCKTIPQINYELESYIPSLPGDPRNCRSHHLVGKYGDPNP